MSAITASILLPAALFATAQFNIESPSVDGARDPADQNKEPSAWRKPITETSNIIPSEKKGTIMVNDRAATYELYLAAWSPVNDDERRNLLRKSLKEEAVFLNMQTPRRGINEIAQHLKEFQTHIPGGTFRLNSLIGWGSNALAEWQLIKPNGEPGFSGYDVLTFTEEGVISNILMFTNVESQKIVWRRRDPVSIEITE